MPLQWQVALGRLNSATPFSTNNYRLLLGEDFFGWGGGVYTSEKDHDEGERSERVFVVLRGVSAGLWCVLKDANVAFGGE